ncbi:GyrI-like domain-containing protein [Anaerococcus sp. Marseille-P3625]|uniref:GyrI-like domain-containing protein n=1 Tax=Anaerococcus sp. Marseille-P3625 TaxID=1977277 RepID=UPI000C070E22|nr:effector binding domain-containing protein [Anaerococcus sp. Marseille-P3625]
MDTNIDKKSAIKLKGKSFKIKNRDEALAIRNDFVKSYIDSKLVDLESFCGLMQYDAMDDSYTYFLGFEIADNEILDDLDFIDRQIDQSLYLEIFLNEEESLEDAYRYAYEEFFPNKKYFHNLSSDVEFYQYDMENKRIGNSELYISLMKNPHIV